MEQPESPSPGAGILLGPRQITAVLVVAILAVGIFCSLSYIAGRSATSPAVAVRPAPLVVKAVVPAPAPVALVAVPEAAPPQAIATWTNAPPVSGAVYLQLMSVETGAAEVFAEGLHAEGFDAIAAPGSSPLVQRVLVGPLQAEAIAATRKRLEARGFHPFVKRYSESAAPVAPPKAASQSVP